MIFLAICMIITLVILYVVVQELKDQKKENKELIRKLKELQSLVYQYGTSISTMGDLRDSLNALAQEFQDISKKNASIKTDLVRTNNLITRTRIEVRKLSDKSIFDRKETQDEQNDRD